MTPSTPRPSASPSERSVSGGPSTRVSAATSRSRSMAVRSTCGRAAAPLRVGDQPSSGTTPDLHLVDPPAAQRGADRAGRVGQRLQPGGRVDVGQRADAALLEAAVDHDDLAPGPGRGQRHRDHQRGGGERPLPAQEQHARVGLALEGDVDRGQHVVAGAHHLGPGVGGLDHLVGGVGAGRLVPGDQRARRSAGPGRRPRRGGPGAGRRSPRTRWPARRRSARR